MDEDRLMLFQIAFAVVGDSSDYISMSIDSRVGEIKRVYSQLLMLIEGREEKRDSLAS
jgi:hypothetical protein